ncbi:MAG: DUF4190 domain-containing protein [Chloroflexia bacterium]|nr:DUF4190 domain-containing protein [Chloroflexia bacterium]
MGLSAAAAPAPPAAVGKNTLAGVSLASGILGWTLLPVLGAVAAIVTGHLAFRSIQRSEGLQGGRNRAKIGLALGYAQVVLGLLILIL